MAVMAFGDESVRWAGLPEPAYLLGAYVCAEGDDTLTDSLTSFARGPKLHWRDTPKPVTRRVCAVIGSSSAAHVVVAAAPLGHGVREEAARQRSLATLTSVLVEQYGVTALTLERRQYAQDMKDQATVEVARLSLAIPEGFELVHHYGQEDARLWGPTRCSGRTATRSRATPAPGICWPTGCRSSESTSPRQRERRAL